MGNFSGKTLKPRQKDTMGTNVVGDEVADAQKWCKQLITDSWSDIQTIWSDASEEDKANICEILGMDVEDFND